MKLKTRQRFLSLILTLCLLLSMTVQSVWAEGATGTLVFQNATPCNGNTVTYNNDDNDIFTLQVTYDGMESEIEETGYGTETYIGLQNVPSGADLTFTLSTPESYTGALPDLMISGAREFFDENKRFTTSFNFSEMNRFMISLEFPNNGGSDPEGDGGNNNGGSTSSNGSLEFQLSSGDTFANTTITYASGYTLNINYEGIGNNVISTDENGHTELRNIPSGVNVTFTLGVPSTANGPNPVLMLEGEEKAFSEYNTYTQSFSFTSEKNIYSVSLFFENTDGGGGGNSGENPVDPPVDTQPGDILFRINRSEGGHVFYSFEENSESWTEIHNNDVLSKNDLAGKTSVYVKYSLEEGYKLDDYIDDTDHLSVNRVYIDKQPSALSFTQNIAQFSYSPDKPYTVEIRFMNNSNPLPPQTGNLDIDVQVTYWVYKQLEETDPNNPGHMRPAEDENGNPVMGYVAFNPGIPNTLINGVKVNNVEPENQENPSGSLTFNLAGYKLDDTEHKNVFFFNTEFGAKINEAYLLKKDETNNLQKIEGTDFREATGANDESTWTLEAAPQASYDIAIVPGISDDLTIIWTTDWDRANTWNPNGEFAADMYLEHGQADIVSIKRGNQIIYDETHQNNSVNISDDFGYVRVKRGDNIVLKVIPDYGYQLASANINGNDLVPEDKEVSTFYINNIQNNLHFSGIFEEANNTSTNNLAFSVPDTISNVVSSGTLNMEAAETDLNENIVPENYTGINTYDITLENRVSKGEADSYWVNPVTDLGNATATVSLKAEGLDPNAEYKVLRQHENEDPVLLDATFDPNDQTLNFETNKFSAYTIITPTPACTTHRWNPTITFAADGKTASYTAVCDVCTAPAFGNAVVTSAVKTAATYTEKGTTTYTATVLLDGQTFTATKDVQDIPVLTRPEEPTTPAEPTTPVEPTTPAEPTTPVEPPKPTAPVYAATTISKIENTTSGVKLTWKKVPKASGYYIYRGSSKIKTLTSTSKVSYTDTKAKKNGGKYTYRVYAYYKVSGGKIKTSAASPAKSTIYLSRPSTPSAKNYYRRKAVAKWNKNTKASGYKVECCLRSNFSGSKLTATLHRNSSVTKKFTDLKKGKTYYFRVRSYKTINGTTYYSPWSKTCSRKIKK